MVCTDVCTDEEKQLNLFVFSLKVLSNLDRIINILFGNPDNTWRPADDDNDRTLEIILPDVNGVPAGGYDIMRITFKQTGTPVPVTVKIVDKAGKTVLEVSPVSPSDFI